MDYKDHIIRETREIKKLSVLIDYNPIMKRTEKRYHLPNGWAGYYDDCGIISLELYIILLLLGVDFEI